MIWHIWRPKFLVLACHVWLWSEQRSARGRMGWHVSLSEQVSPTLFPTPHIWHHPSYIAANLPLSPQGQITQAGYDSFSDVGEIRVYRRAHFQSGSRVLKKVFWTFSYLYLWHTMWFHAKKLLKTLKFWKSLNSLCKSGSRPQKSPKKSPKTDNSIAIYLIF